MRRVWFMVAIVAGCGGEVDADSLSVPGTVDGRCILDVAVAPAELDFVTVSAGRVATLPLMLRAPDCGDVIIDRLVFLPVGTPFSAPSAGPTTTYPAVLHAGVPATLEIRAAPPADASGEINDWMLIHTNIARELNYPGRVGALFVPLNVQVVP